MLDMTTLRKLHDQLNQDAIDRALALYALFENMPLAEVRHSAVARVTSRRKTGRIGSREVSVTIKWLGERRFIIWDIPHQALAKLEVAA